MPAPGEYPELDAETRVPILIGISIAFVVLSSIVVALRLYTRYVIVKVAGPDDITIAIAQVGPVFRQSLSGVVFSPAPSSRSCRSASLPPPFSVSPVQNQYRHSFSPNILVEAKYALGRHVWMVDDEGIIQQLKVRIFFPCPALPPLHESDIFKALFAAMVIYNLSQIVTKVSFLLLYRRIFQNDLTRRLCVWLLMFLIAWGITQEVLIGVACVPVSVFVPSRQDKCIDSLTVWYLTSIMNIVTDFIVFMVPMPSIKGLQLRRKQKILVFSIFCLGFL
jgi:hypothetical protein